jgi:asparagine synthase (glutamine-hydrolysing)
MCGIVGGVNWGSLMALKKGNLVQACRGPDDSGVWETNLSDNTWVGLGNRRLAIIDLSEAGHMPMGSEDGKTWITYNGELYNLHELRSELMSRGHHFRSNTDTEVVLRLYLEFGPDCLNKMNGMFALAIWDGHKECLFLARDHFGIKPLYYRQVGEKLVFASEIKALLTLTNERVNVDHEALHQYMSFLWVPDPLTMFKGVYDLPAGCYATWKHGAFQITKYWDLHPPMAGAVFPLGEDELIEAIQEKFRKSVQAQTISDVPLGAFLSAGIDSSSIVAMLSEMQSTPVRTFTIAFPRQHTIGQATLDDTDVARRTASHFNCIHSEIKVEPDVTALLPKLIWHMDEPVADPAIIAAYLVCKEASKNVSVLLSGVGGDEVFGGYRKHRTQHWARLYRRIPSLARHHLIEPAILSIPAMRNTFAKDYVRLAQKAARSWSLSPVDGFMMDCTYLTELQKAVLYTEEFYNHTNGLDPWNQHRSHFQEVSHADFLNQALYVDIKSFMASLNLKYNDKMSMASSVEVRVPFLERHLVEFVVQNVPPHLKVNGMLKPKGKYILRKAVKDILPAEVLQQPKAGFGMPIDHWLANDLRDMTGDLLSDKVVRDRGYFRPQTVRKLLEEHRSGRHDWSMQIWQLLTLELWHRSFVDSTAHLGAVGS